MDCSQQTVDTSLIVVKAMAQGLLLMCHFSQVLDPAQPAARFGDPGTDPFGQLGDAEAR